MQLLFKITILVISFFFVACASKSIPTNVVFDNSSGFMVKGLIKEDNPKTIKDQTIKSIISGHEDNVTKNKKISHIEALKFPVDSCQNKIDILQEAMTSSEMSNAIAKSVFDHEYSFFRKSHISRKEFSLTATDSSLLVVLPIEYQFSTTIGGEWKQVVATISVHMLGSYQCLEDKSLAYSIYISQYDIKNPSSILAFGNIAALDFRITNLQSNLQNFHETITSIQASLIQGTVKSSVTELFSMIKSRYVGSSEELKVERIYPLEFDVAVARLQRNLEYYKYEQEKSTLSFDDTLYISCENADKAYYGKDYKGRSCSFPINYTIKLYPETSKKTAVVFSFKYPQLTDKFSNKIIYSDKDANKYFQLLLNSIDNLMK